MRLIVKRLLFTLEDTKKMENILIQHRVRNVWKNYNNQK